MKRRIIKVLLYLIGTFCIVYPLCAKFITFRNQTKSIYDYKKELAQMEKEELQRADRDHQQERQRDQDQPRQQLYRRCELQKHGVLSHLLPISEFSLQTLAYQKPLCYTCHDINRKESQSWKN